MLETPRLAKVQFTEQDFDAVQGFACGNEPWELYLAQWITNTAVQDERTIVDLLRDGTKVWLYYAGQGNLVGYGSLGVTRWKYPEPFGPTTATIGVIPAVAVSSAYQGQPLGDWRQRYSTEILMDLITTATQNYSAGVFPDPALGLFVDTRNVRAKTVYTRLGFTDYGKPLKQEGYYLQRMRVKLNASTDVVIEK